MTETTRRLSWLQEHLTGLVAAAPRDVVVRGVTHDSRRVKPGYVFVAIRGFADDGHRYVGDAVKRGAAAVVVEGGGRSAAQVPVMVVEDTRRALAELAAAFWGWPSQRLKVVGVTGTNGKTTTALLVAAIARQAGMKAVALGTLGIVSERDVEPTEHTTLEASDLQRMLAELVESGVELVSMEVSSHGLALERVWQTYFDVAALTNISHDHLDFHGDIEEYAGAKELLFTRYAELAAACKKMTACINLDDERARGIAERALCEVMFFSARDRRGQVRAENVELGARGTKFDLVLPSGRNEVRTPLVGWFNVENALAAAACATALGVEGGAICAGLSKAQPAPGRLEPVDEGQDFMVLVDYAHTPDALGKVLQEARRLAEGRVICVFGCGGDRDPAKRPRMGEVATELADWTIITSDNPRSEPPELIIQAIEDGAEAGRYETIVDRRQAIAKAIGTASKGDVVLIAGKGHEDYQILGDRVIHFDDREEARKALRRLLAGEPTQGSHVRSKGSSSS